MRSKSKPRRPRLIVVLVLLAIAVPGGYYLARYQAWPAYKDWREARLVRMAGDFMAAHDYDNALLTARQALRNNQRDVAHWRLAVAAAKAKGTPEVIYYQQNVARLDKSLASQLELLRLTMQFSDYRDAVDTIENIDPSAKRNAEFHRLAAETYQRIGRPVPAKLHLYSLISLEPGDHAARLDLAQIELAEDTAGQNQKLRADIRALSRQPELRLRALSLLLKDALARTDRPQAGELAEELRAMPDLTGEQRVLVLAGLTQGLPDEADAYRHQLQSDIAGDPRATIALADYYRQDGSRVEARRWFESLPQETRKNIGVQEAIAHAFLEWKEWARLNQALLGAQWKQREFMRQAFTAYSARQNGRLADAGNAWRLAVIQAGDSVSNTSELLALVSRWGWQSEQYDLVWKLFALMPRNESISRQLLAWERFQGHTANLNRIFARLAEFSGDDAAIKNNLAYSSLLLDANLSKAYELALANYKTDPQNPFYVTTQAFALYKQNKPAEALALLETLRPAALSSPERTMFRALFRAASGNASGAADLLPGLKTAGFLPEERRLVTQTTREIARLDGQKGEDQRLYALSSRGEIDRAKGWMKMLPESVRTGATVEMLASDSLFAMGDLNGLGAQLRNGSWREQEHLRLALTAYVARAHIDEGSALSYWRTALGTAAGNPAKLGELETLATQWNWKTEKTDVLARIFDIDPSNQATFVELMDHYRAAGRTPELVAVLNSYLSAHPSDQAQRCGLAYYSMLSGVNVSRAYVAAREIYDAAPEEIQRRLVYAFSLWKQRRPQEAWELIEKSTASENELVPVPLLRAAVLADMDRPADAAETLKSFDRKRALPEESRLAAVVASRLKADSRLTRLN